MLSVRISVDNVFAGHLRFESNSNFCEIQADDGRNFGPCDVVNAHGWRGCEVAAQWMCRPGALRTATEWHMVRAFISRCHMEPLAAGIAECEHFPNVRFLASQEPVDEAQRRSGRR